MACIPEYLTNEIKEKVNIFRNKNTSTIRLLCAKTRQKEIVKNAQIHSYHIENPDNSVPFSIPRKSREIKQGIKDIRSAFQWGAKNFDPYTFNEEFVRILAAKIDPFDHQGKDMADYTTISARFKTTTPYPEKIEEKEMPEFVSNLRTQFARDEQTPDIIQEMKSAIYAHFNLVRIHPFYDSNGRTARTLQDIILDYYNFPFPIIESGERATYHKLIERAVIGYDDRKSENKQGLSEEERDFYTFIAGKINVSLDKILKCLRKDTS
jgi:Fic family protein